MIGIPKNRNENDATRDKVIKSNARVAGNNLPRLPAEAETSARLLELLDEPSSNPDSSEREISATCVSETGFLDQLPVSTSKSVDHAGLDISSETSDEPRTTANIQSTQQVRKVTFASQCSMFFVSIHEQREQLWITSSERSKSQTDILKTIKNMRKHKPPDNEQSYRGLEHQSSKESFKSQKMSRKRLVEVVLEFQKAQKRDSCYFNYLKILELAEVSKKQSEKAKEVAYMRGKCDEAVARRFQISDKRAVTENLIGSNRCVSQQVLKNGRQLFPKSTPIARNKSWP